MTEGSHESPKPDLRELFDGDFLRLVEDATGKSADEIRAMNFEQRRQILSLVGVNLPEPKPDQMKKAS